MQKRKILTGINAVLSIFFLITLFSGFALVPITSLESFISDYTPSLMLLLFTIINATLTYFLLSKRQLTTPFAILTILTFSTLFWFLAMIIGHFFASSIWFLITAFLIIGAVYAVIRKTSSKVALIVALISMLVVMVIMASSFEEDYCWSKGEEADETGTEMVIATQQDAKDLKEFNVEAGTPIGKSFRVHMLCHTTFSFSKALQEKYKPS